MELSITDFEDISGLEPEMVVSCLKDVPESIIVKAYMGTSPTNAEWLEKVFPDIEFRKEAQAIGRIRIEEIDEAQMVIVRTLAQK